MLSRGDIHYIYEGKSVGSEIYSGRPAIIVSNDALNVQGNVVEIVYLTTQPKADMQTHVTIRSSLKVSTALCEQVSTVSVERVGDFAGKCTKAEMEAIEAAIRYSLALDIPATEPVKQPAADAIQIADLRQRLVQETAAKEMYKNMYDEIINKVLERAK